jgi:hypothetical protein
VLSASTNIPLVPDAIGLKPAEERIRDYLRDGQSDLNSTHTIASPGRGGRVAEGTRLLSEYGVSNPIEGSNPSLSVLGLTRGTWGTPVS